MLIKCSFFVFQVSWFYHRVSMVRCVGSLFEWVHSHAILSAVLSEIIKLPFSFSAARSKIKSIKQKVYRLNERSRAFCWYTQTVSEVGWELFLECAWHCKYAALICICKRQTEREGALVWLVCFLYTTAQDQTPEQCNFLIIAQSLAVRTRFILLFSAAVVQLKNANKIYLLTLH